MSSVSQLFDSLHLTKWWQSNLVTQAFGTNGEKGTDFGLGGFGQPVGSLTGGRVVYVGDGGYPGSSIGQIVQILMPDGRLIHYQHLMNSSVQVGQLVQPGQVIGHGGGCPVGGYPANGQGNACTFTDQWSTGQHIEVRLATSYNPTTGVWTQNWIAPLTTFQSLANQQVSGATPPVGSGTGSPIGGVAGGATNVGVVPPPPINPSNFFAQTGQHIALFLVALVLVAAGLFVAFSKQIGGAFEKAKGTTEKVAVAA